METGCSESFEDGPALRIGTGLFDSSVKLLEWTHLPARPGGKGPLSETENEIKSIYLLIHCVREEIVQTGEQILLQGFGTVV